jgi:hypothetical protein
VTAYVVVDRKDDLDRGGKVKNVSDGDEWVCCVVKNELFNLLARPRVDP